MKRRARKIRGTLRRAGREVGGVRLPSSVDEAAGATPGEVLARLREALGVVRRARRRLDDRE
jgi:hypothetical protein